MTLSSHSGHEEKDLPHIQKIIDSFDGEVTMATNDGYGILALQGPKAMSVFSRHVEADLTEFDFMSARTMTVAGVEDCFVTRSGYTGEDGFEITVPPAGTLALAEALLAEPEVPMIITSSLATEINPRLCDNTRRWNRLV